MLTAEFTISMPGDCLFSIKDGEDTRFKTTINGFFVELIIPWEQLGSGRSKMAYEENWTQSLKRVLVQVCREEPTEAPGISITPDGMRDLTKQGQYFLEIIPDYAEAAREAANRLILFFRFRLNTPMLQEISARSQCLASARWYDGKGTEIGVGPRMYIGRFIPGLNSALGVKKLTTDSFQALEFYLSQKLEPSVPAQLLDGARSSWFEGNLQRTVLELAIACEVMVKRRFFSTDAPSGAAFDYLEDKARVNIRVPELLDAVAKAVFGKSFKTDSSVNFANIEFLLQCRNKLAHRGELSFRNQAGEKIIPEAKTVENWFTSVLLVSEWLINLET
jgi:hypothetical protein